MKLIAVAKKVEDSVDETLEYMAFPREHWRKIRSNNVIERLNREIRRRTRVVGTFPDGNSALMLVCARLRYMEHYQVRQMCERPLTVPDRTIPEIVPQHRCSHPGQGSHV